MIDSAHQWQRIEDTGDTILYVPFAGSGRSVRLEYRLPSGSLLVSDDDAQLGVRVDLRERFDWDNHTGLGGELREDSLDTCKTFVVIKYQDAYDEEGVCATRLRFVEEYRDGAVVRREEYDLAVPIPAHLRGIYISETSFEPEEHALRNAVCGRAAAQTRRPGSRLWHATRDLPVMRALRIITAGVLTGLAGATILYALLVAWYVMDTPTLDQRGLYAMRVSAVLFVCLITLVLATRTMKRYAMRGRWVLGLVALLCTGVAFFVTYLYPVWTAPPARDGARLRALATTINAARGAPLRLPAEYTYAIERGPQRLRIHVSDRLIARVLGVDMSKLDDLAVELDNAGNVQRAWVDYF